MGHRRRMWNPRLWAGFVPNGLGQVKPNHYWEMVRVAWQNRDQLPFAWRILRRGVCDGCALGTTGLRDFTMKGIHLCTVRLNLLRLNTMPALPVERLSDVKGLQSMTAAELRSLGRLPYPMLRRGEEKGFQRISWDQALELAAERIRKSEPRRIAVYLTSRGITNEVYYVAQKVARFLGTNNVDNSARVCHAPSTTAMKQTLGVSASTCSYADWIGTDLLVFIGSDVPNNQPVTTKYLYYAKQLGARVMVINTYREPGLERYWVPSVLESALFGTKLADEFFLIHTGGDIAFINGVLKHLVEREWTQASFIRDHTAGFDRLRDTLAEMTWEFLESRSGSTRQAMLRFAEGYARADKAVFVWSMGVTQHRHGVENVQSIINLALSRGMVGREKCGLMPIRGHSGVQGGAEVGAVPGQLPGGIPIDEASAKTFEALWGFPIPTWRGLQAPEMIEAAHQGGLDLLYAVGGNFLDTLPEPDFVRESLGRVPFRIHQDLIVSPQMLIDPAEAVLLLPAQSRYEQRGGGTETSTERRILFSPEIPGRRIGESKPEWEIPMLIAERSFPGRRTLIHFENAQAIRNDIARSIPFYAGIEKLKKNGDAVQWGGPRLCENGSFGTRDGLGHFSAVRPPGDEIQEGWFQLSTRRGKQFNSMIQDRRDPLTGARREDVFISLEDAKQLGLHDGDPVLLRSKAGEFRGRCKIAHIRPRNLQVHWPEGNVLIERAVRDPACGIPDYNALVQVLPLVVERSARTDR